jgi:DNA-binding NarL/FixJ family response regulator
VLVLVTQRRLDEAEALLESEIGRQSAMVSAGLRFCWLAWANVRLARHDATGALEIAERLIATTQPGVAPRVWLLRAEALSILGRTADSLELLSAARACAVERSARSVLWRIDAFRARVLRTLGKRDLADEAASAAHGLVHELAAGIDDQTLRARFLAAVAPSLPTVSTPTPARIAKQRYGGLTSREREVARLVARGLSNRAIADELVLGERTIETYVGNILSKLGFTSRAQIAAWVVENGLSTADP